MVNPIPEPPTTSSGDGNGGSDNKRDRPAGNFKIVSNGPKFEERLNKCFLKNDLPAKDLKVMVAKGAMFRIHKDLFMISSPEFASLVMRGEKGNLDVESSVKLPLEPDTFRVINYFLYLNDLDHPKIEITGIDHALSILDASIVYKIDLLEPHILTKVTSMVARDNALKVVEIARQLVQVSPKFKVLEDKALNVICREAGDLINSDGFAKLGSYTVTEILSSDDLLVENELEVYKAAKRWAEEQAKAKRCRNIKRSTLCYFNKVKDCIRFPLMTPEELAMVSVDDHLFEKEYLLSLFKYVCLPPNWKKLAAADARFVAKQRNNSISAPTKTYAEVETQTDEISDKRSMLPPLTPPVKRARLTLDSDTSTSVSFSTSVTVMGEKRKLQLQDESSEDDELFSRVRVFQRKDEAYPSFEDVSRRLCKKESKNEISAIYFKRMTFEHLHRPEMFKHCRSFGVDANYKFISSANELRIQRFIEFVSNFDPMKYLVIDRKGNLPMVAENIWSMDQNMHLKFNGVTFLKVVHDQVDLNKEDGVSKPKSEIVLNYIRSSCKILSNTKMTPEKIALSNCEFSTKVMKDRTKQVKTLILYRCWGEFTMKDIVTDFPEMEELICWKYTPSKCKDLKKVDGTKKPNLLNQQLVFCFSNFPARQHIRKLVLFHVNLQFPQSTRAVKNLECNVNELYLDHCYRTKTNSMVDVFKALFPKLKKFVLVESSDDGDLATADVVNCALEVESLEWLQVNGMKWTSNNMDVDISENDSPTQTFEQEEAMLLEVFKQSDISSKLSNFRLEKSKRGRSVIWDTTPLNDPEKESTEVDGGVWSERDAQEYEWWNLGNFYDSLEAYEDYFLQQDDFPRQILWI